MTSGKGYGAMLRVGLTGGIGSGRAPFLSGLPRSGRSSSTGTRPRGRSSNPGHQGSRASRRPSGGRAAADGSLDRAKLAGIVFSDEGARQKLNAITHPLIHEHILAAERAAVAARGPDTVVVHDIPLLAEGQRAADFDAVIVVDVPADLQVARLAGRGLPQDQARARMAAQASREQRLALADIVIDNSGTLEDLDRRVSEVWADLQARVKRRTTSELS